MKRFWIVLLLLVLLVGAWVLLPGFTKASDAYLGDYEVNGSTMTVQAGVAGSMGFLRSVKVKTWQDGKIDLVFYHAFGGINGSLGAKDTFSFDLPENARMIRVYRRDQCYEEILFLDPVTETWERK